MILKKRCPHCNKVIESLYKKQLDYNYQAHVLACKQKIMEQENRDIKLKEVKKDAI